MPRLPAGRRRFREGCCGYTQRLVQGHPDVTAPGVPGWVARRRRTILVPYSACPKEYDGQDTQRVHGNHPPSPAMIPSRPTPHHSAATHGNWRDHTRAAVVLADEVRRCPRWVTLDPRAFQIRASTVPRDSERNPLTGVVQIEVGP